MLPFSGFCCFDVIPFLFVSVFLLIHLFGWVSTSYGSQMVVLFPLLAFCFSIVLSFSAHLLFNFYIPSMNVHFLVIHVIVLAGLIIWFTTSKFHNSGIQYLMKISSKFIENLPWTEVSTFNTKWGSNITECIKSMSCDLF